MSKKLEVYQTEMLPLYRKQKCFYYQKVIVKDNLK